SYHRYHSTNHHLTHHHRKDSMPTPGILSLFLLMFILLSGLFLSFQKPLTATAATNQTINFQARLLSAAGNIAPDGNYNVEFKLYDASSSSGSSQGSCGSDSHCLWTETR